MLRDPVKAKMKKRLSSGLREVLRAIRTQVRLERICGVLYVHLYVYTYTRCSICIFIRIYVYAVWYMYTYTYTRTGRYVHTLVKAKVKKRLSSGLREVLRSTPEPYPRNY